MTLTKVSGEAIKDLDFGSENIATTGSVTVGTGSDSSPSIVFDSDANTGIYSPGADQVAISTNGQGRLFVDANGNVGLNTESPNGKLSLAKGGTYQFRAIDVANNTAEYSIYVDQDNIGSNSFSIFDTTNSHTTLRYLPGASGYWQFYTNNDERLHLTSTGTLMHLGAGNSTTPAVQFNGSAPVNSLVIDSSGRLLVGTSTGTGGREKLQVMGNTTGSTGSGEMTLAKGSSVAIDDLIGVIGFTGSSNESFATITAWGDGTTGASDYPGRLVFSTTADGAGSPSPRMTIKNDGKVGIGTTGPAEELHVVGDIVATGDITAFYSSDRRLKKDIESIPNAVDKVKQINGVSYAWNDEYLKDKEFDGYFVREREVGVIAQEVEEVLPELVATRDNGYKAVKYDRLVALLIEAVKEQQQQIDELKAKLEG